MAELLGRRTEALEKVLELKVKAVDGREVDLSKLRGKVVLLDFWATRCPPCVALMPTLKALYEKYQPKGFEIIGINSDEQKAQMTRFLAQEKVPWLQYYDSGDARVGSRLGIYQIPALWLVDKQGVVRDNKGVYDLEAKIQKLLAE
jgi:thiol-disulfide isomerase/thioredoxin